jgi:archaellum component FlaG (FlaF/FlaG flagellin family)
MHDLIFFIFSLIFIAFFAFFFWVVFMAVSHQMRINAQNRASALLNREAVIVSKRQNVSGGSETSTSTYYYLTFEFTDGSREEFRVTGEEYGLLAEGDRGTLQSQGTWYKGFNRL